MAANEASRLGGDICCLQQPRAASGVRTGVAVQGGAVDSGAAGRSSPGRAVAGQGAFAMGGADISAPGNGISFHCDWIREESAAPIDER